MESVRRSEVTPRKSRLARTVAKVLRLRTATTAGVSRVDTLQKVAPEKVCDDENVSNKKSLSSWLDSFDNSDDEHVQRAIALEALAAKLFASVSSVKAGYAQLQYCQSPYDADGIQTADQMVVSELKSLSELKQSYAKKQMDIHPESTMAKAEMQETKSLAKTYEIMSKKLDNQLRLKESEIMYMKEKLEEANRLNKQFEKRLNQSGQFHMPENFVHSSLTPGHFITAHRHTVRSIRSLVKVMISEMRACGWDLDAAAESITPGVVYRRADDKCFAFESITPGVVYRRADDKCFAFESYTCKVMFDLFHFPYFSTSKDPVPPEQRSQMFFKRFLELKSVKAKEYLTSKPRSTFAKFLRAKYSKLVHPEMEMSLYGNVNQRDVVGSGGFPDSGFFAAFAEAARRVWLLHCLAFSFQPEASIFQVRPGSRFSEVYMECVAVDGLMSSDNAPEADPPVALTVVPGFRIGKTVIHCQVYLSQVR